MDGFISIALSDMLKAEGEDRVKSILSNFSCPLNRDVEQFIKNKAIEFDKQGIAATHLIFTSFKGEPVLIASVSYTHLLPAPVHPQHKQTAPPAVRRKHGSDHQGCSMCSGNSSPPYPSSE